MQGRRTRHPELSFKGEIHLSWRAMTTKPSHHPARGQTLALSTPLPVSYLRRIPKPVVYV